MHGQRRTTLKTLAAAASFAVLGGLGLASPTHARAAGPQPLEYVALGDSFPAGPTILPAAAGAPANCGRSAVNYPNLTVQALGLRLTDASCSNAQVGNLTSAQFTDQPPQFDALTNTTSVVTLSIGGNDNNLFLKAFLLCGTLSGVDILDIGAPCKTLFGTSLSHAIAADEVNIAAVLREIRRRSPDATVFVVGYPALLPQSGACRPQVPMTTKDIAYLDGIEKDLNAMLARAAGANGATYVDTYTPTIGHDACKDPSVRWVEPYDPGNGAQPVHPNAAGHRAVADVVTAAMAAAGL